METPTVEDVIDALHRLVRTGAYPHRFAVMPDLLRLPAVLVRAQPKAGRRALARIAHACLIEAVNDETNPDRYRAYSYLFTLTPEAEALQEQGGVEARRDQARAHVPGQSHRGGGERWRREGERAFLRPLAERLIQLPTPSDPAEDHEFISSRRDSYVDERDVLTASDSILRVRSLRPGHKRYSALAEYEHAHDARTLQPERLFGCDIEVTERRDDIVTFDVVFDHPLELNETHDYGYRTVATTSTSLRSDDGRCWIRGRVTRSYNNNVLRVHIDDGDEVRDAWWFILGSDLEVPGRPSAATRLRIDRSGWMERTFPPMARGSFYGLAWSRKALTLA